MSLIGVEHPFIIGDVVSDTSCFFIHESKMKYLLRIRLPQIQKLRETSLILHKQTNVLLALSNVKCIVLVSVLRSTLT